MSLQLNCPLDGSWLQKVLCIPKVPWLQFSLRIGQACCDGGGGVPGVQENLASAFPLIGLSLQLFPAGHPGGMWRVCWRKESKL